MLLLDYEFIPLYDFSGNSRRSTLNSLRKYYPDSKITFYREFSFHSEPSLPHPYPVTAPSCILFF
nr:MAG TPA: hypothetical protein [Microviridae sp.]